MISTEGGGRGAGTVKCACATRTGNRRLAPARPPRNTQDLLLASTAHNRDSATCSAAAAATCGRLAAPLVSSAQAALLARREYLPSKFSRRTNNRAAALRSTLNISSAILRFVALLLSAHAAASSAASHTRTHRRGDVQEVRERMHRAQQGRGI